MVFSFKLQEIKIFQNATAIIAAGDNPLIELKFSPEMFSLILDCAPTAPRCFISLQFFPQFFTQFSCHQLQHSWIYADSIFPTFSNCHHHGFSSLLFSSQHQDHVDLKFQAPNGRVLESGFRTYYTSDASDVGEFSLDTFVAIDSRVFVKVAQAFQHIHSNILVTLTKTTVKFTTETTSGITLTQERRRYIIGGVGADCEIIFNITLQPVEILCNMARQSKSVWLFKVVGPTSAGLMSFPLGLNARFLAYFPRWRTRSWYERRKSTGQKCCCFL